MTLAGLDELSARPRQAQGSGAAAQGSWEPLGACVRSGSWVVAWRSWTCSGCASARGHGLLAGWRALPVVHCFSSLSLFRSEHALPTTVEQLTPVAGQAHVEIPSPTSPHLDKAYREVAQQVTIPGFRKGKVPNMVIDQRFGRGMVLQEAINAALPTALEAAIVESGVVPLGSRRSRSPARGR